MTQELQLLASQRHNRILEYSLEAPRLLAVIGEGSDISAESKLYISGPEQDEPEDSVFRIEFEFAGNTSFSENIDSINHDITHIRQLKLGKAMLRGLEILSIDADKLDSNESNVTNSWDWFPDATNSKRNIPMIAWYLHEYELNLDVDSLIINAG